MTDIRHSKDNNVPERRDNRTELSNFVLDKSIFSNIFEKDIRRVYIYKKAERLAKAIDLIAPAFQNSLALKDKLETVAVGLIEAAVLAPSTARSLMARELLTLSSLLSIARASGKLSLMNADLIANEAQALLQEIASYEEPRLMLPDAPSLAELARAETKTEGATTRPISRISTIEQPKSKSTKKEKSQKDKGQYIGHISDKKDDRKQAIRAVLKAKGPSYIKDISTVIRDVSEKTIQRELQALVSSGEVERTGERRWTVYALS